ncbi:hypothetical protein [Rhodococcus sp. NCIMB 12038]|uniref:hypothetical protein n=1 Tax=Rhodococcus sp. NCIMB 12038 TaxID=933800 RepID=UPI000B3BF725|nr:hypothetical protein [Rhodococcus sp. NCIMB 12038]OUS92499.1 hypothetical protein CA951_28875 [Rhodococcus sp. NCIMB 12038]
MCAVVATPESDSQRRLTELRRLVGTTIVAYRAGVADTRTVQRWVEGSSLLPEQVILDRMSVALDSAQMLSARECPAVVQSWFVGRNPALGDHAPAQVLREDDSVRARGEVEHAAREFAAHGFNS